MSAADKLGNAAQDAKGEIKEGVGKTLGNESMEGEGKLDQGKAEVKDRVEDVKDTAKESLSD